MKKMFLFFSHKLTNAQIEDAKNSLGVSEFAYLPDNLQELWSSVPPELESLKKYLKPLQNFLLQNAKKDDFVLVQGDFCGVYDMVNFAKDSGFVALCSTTKRDVKERVVGDSVEKFSVFTHIRFRRY